MVLCMAVLGQLGARPLAAQLASPVESKLAEEPPADIECHSSDDLSSRWPKDERPPMELTARAKQLHESGIVVDGHNDLPWQIRKYGNSSFTKLDISQSHPELHTDIPRLRQGGLDVQFWSVWVPADTMESGQSLLTTLEQIQIVKAMIARYPETFRLALNVEEIEACVADHRIASLIGVEGGHSIEGSLQTLRQLYREGARYMTLTHSRSLAWADSATDEQPLSGLSPFGEEVIREMNRLGMLVDLSHVSVECMKDALRLTRAPIIFSHSSSRAIADHPRNVPDEVLKRLPENGGVVMVNFYSGYTVPQAAARTKEQSAKRAALKIKFPDDEAAVQRAMKRWQMAHPIERGTIHTILDHIDHIVQVAGVDHVGLGSDFDGISTVPRQLDDVSCYPFITQGLLDRAYSESDIRKILGQNVLRVLRQAEAVSAEMAKESR